jgi:hypothetical protein
MKYFTNVREQDKVYGLIYGKGVVRTVLNGHYHFEVEYENGQVVPYTEDGIPGWNTALDFQTVFYKDNIDLYTLDFSPVQKILSPKKIIKLRNDNMLEVRCPSGAWIQVNKCPQNITEDYLENKQFHLFRKLEL